MCCFLNVMINFLSSDHVGISFYSLPKYFVTSGWLPSLSDTPPMAEYRVLKPENLNPWAFLRHRTMVLSWLSSFPERCAPLEGTWGQAISAINDMGRCWVRKPINHEDWISSRCFFESFESIVNHHLLLTICLWWHFVFRFVCMCVFCFPNILSNSKYIGVPALSFVFSVIFIHGSEVKHCKWLVKAFPVSHCID